MKIKKFQINRIFFFLLVFLPIYQDTPLIKYLGAGGYTLLLPISLISLFIYVIITNKLPKNKYVNNLFKLGVLMTVVSYIAILIWLIMGNSIYVLSEFLPFKAFKVALIFFAYVAYVLLIIICSRRNGPNGTYYLGKYSFITLVVLAIICVIEKTQIPNAFVSLHYAGEFPYYRIRLLTMESSWTAPMIYAYSALGIYWSYKNQKKIPLAISLICDIILLINTGSKTVLSIIAVFAIVYLITILKKLNRRRLVSSIFGIILLVVFIIFILPSLKTSFSDDIENFTSTATRIYTSIIGLLIGIVFPLGLGGAVSLGVFQSTLKRYLSLLEKLPTKFNTTEIIGLTEQKTGDALTVKSGILNQNMYWGIIGTIILFRNFISVTKELRKVNSKDSDLVTAIFWCAIILLFTCNFTFEFWLIYAFVVSLVEEQKNA